MAQAGPNGSALIETPNGETGNHQKGFQSLLESTKLTQFIQGFAVIKPEFILKHEEILFDTKLISDSDGPKNIENGKRKEDSEERSKKKKMKGQNKNRRNFLKGLRRTVQAEGGKRMCIKFCKEGVCCHGDGCSFSHDLEEFLQNREVDIGETCYNFETFGKCDFGILCRFGSSHLREQKYNIVREEIFAKNFQPKFSNHLEKEVQVSLRKKQYNFEFANSISKQITCGEVKIADCKQEQFELRRKVDFRGKLYLAPLTTVGNLPFRRICKEFGADITCGEMALCTNLLEGSGSEWALLRRHHTEDLFGVQICGGNVEQLTRCVQLVNENCNVDFIDLNMGCPIDLIYKRGGGSALMERRKKLEEIIYCITSVSKVPLTLKMRTGVYQNKNVAKEIVSSVREWKDRVGLLTLHGRSREQRYTRLADWQYIGECAREAHHGLNSISIFGNGDVLSQEEYFERLETSSVDGIMLARGALIKPWIFTEIKEKRTWDISANERFEILKKFVNYGLENWGSDTQGVEKTRRFLLEWLSFLHRYIPVGILHRPPQRINERPPRYFGRNDLETLLSSASCNDWIEISQMLLGKIPDGFTFLPKHKANAY